MVSWGSTSNAITIGGYAGEANNSPGSGRFYRDVVVIRKPKNSKDLYIYYSEPETTYGTTVQSTILTKTTDSYTTMPLIFGAR